MFVKRSYAAPLVPLLVASVIGFLGVTPRADAQVGKNPIQFRVQGPSQRLEMVVSSSRILSLDKEVPRVLVNNTDIVRVIPLSPTQVQVSALRAGVTQVNLWDEDGEVHTIDVVIFGDARELEMLLKTEFPHSSLKVRPLASSVILSGYVDRPEAVSRIIRMAEDYYPKVINNITVGGVQQVLLHVKVMEVLRTKLRSFGFDFAVFNGNDFVVQDVSQLIGAFASGASSVTGSGAATMTFGIIDGATTFFGFLEAAREYNLVKVLAEPTLVTVSGRPAKFMAGGEFPILVPQSLGSVSIEYKQFGTQVDFVPIVLGNGNIRLEVRPVVSEIDSARGVTVNAERIPGLRVRSVDTAVEMRAGQTLALAGLIQNRVEAQNRGLPWLADLPWIGAAFRRVEEQMNEIELVITVRPELVDALDPHQVPQCGPGETLTSPNDVDLFWRGYLEVPRCCQDGNCPSCRGPAESGYQDLPPISIEPSETAPATAPASPPLDISRSAPSFPSSIQPVHSGSNDAPGLSHPRKWGTPISYPRRGPAVVAPDPDRLDPHNPAHSSNPMNVAQDKAVSSDPGIFGPIGYDVLDFKE